MSMDKCLELQWTQPLILFKNSRSLEMESNLKQVLKKLQNMILRQLKNSSKKRKRIDSLLCKETFQKETFKCFPTLLLGLDWKRNFRNLKNLMQRRKKTMRIIWLREEFENWSKRMFKMRDFNQNDGRNIKRFSRLSFTQERSFESNFQTDT